MMFSFLPDVNVSSNPTSPPISSMGAQPMICALGCHKRPSRCLQPMRSERKCRGRSNRLAYEKRLSR